jgi:hypothetical protein
VIEYSFINPLRFKKQGFSSSFNTKYFDQHLLPDTILDFEESSDYHQPWQVSDLIHIQIKTDNLSVQINFHQEEDGDIIHNVFFTQVSTAVIIVGGVPTTFYWMEAYVDLNSVGEGHFYATIVGGSDTLESNKICVQTAQKHTVLIKYFHSEFHEDIIFESGIVFYLRINAFVRHNLPERQSTTYEDQVLNVVNLKGLPYNSWTLITEAHGIPTYMIDMINRACTCDNLFFDDRQFTIPDNSKWEEKQQELYVLRGWGIDIRERVIKSSIAFNGASPTSPVVTPPKKELWADYWTTTPGATSIPSSQPSVVWGFTISQIFQVLEVDREGLEYDIVTVSSPVGRQCKHDAITPKLDFDTAIPFNPGETVNILFKSV